MKGFLFLFSAVFSAFLFPAKAVDIDVTKGTPEVFGRYMQELSPYRALPVNELFVKTALFFVNTPYVANTLEKNEQEKLVVNLTEFDCTTFVENCIALTLMLKSDRLCLQDIDSNLSTGIEDTPFNRYCLYLQKIRYRDGKIEGYPSRLHYMTDWAYNNEQNGILKNITIDLGGNIVRKQIDFMSKHPQSYRHLSDNKTNLEEIINIEKNVNSRGEYAIIQKKDIPNIKNKINSGDIIIFATSIDGLDYTHVGIAYDNRGIVCFIHASTKTMKVKIDEQTIDSYCMRSKNCTGITVLRLR